MADDIQHEIPAKQRHYAGTKDELKANLLEREIGFCTADSCCYIKGTDGELHVLGGFDLAPEIESVLTGHADGTYEWAAPDAMAFDFDAETSKVTNRKGDEVSASQIASLASDGAIPLLLVRVGGGHSIVAVATLVGFSSGGLRFASAPNEAGQSYEIAGSIYGTTWWYTTRALVPAPAVSQKGQVLTVVDGATEGTVKTGWANSAAAATNVITYDSETDSVTDANGAALTGSQVAEIITAGSVPVMLVRQSAGGNIMRAAIFSNWSSGGVIFRAPIDSYGNIHEYGGAIMGDTWWHEVKTLS